MESLKILVIGLCVRFLISSLLDTHLYLRTSTMIVGAWEAIALKHLSTKLIHRSDLILGYGLRIFLDLLATSNFSRQVAIMMWTILGIIIAELWPIFGDDVLTSQVPRYGRAFVDMIRVIARLLRPVASVPRMLVVILRRRGHHRRAAEAVRNSSSGDAGAQVLDQLQLHTKRRLIPGAFSVADAGSETEATHLSRISSTNSAILDFQVPPTPSSPVQRTSAIQSSSIFSPMWSAMNWQNSVHEDEQTTGLDENPWSSETRTYSPILALNAVSNTGPSSSNSTLSTLGTTSPSQNPSALINTSFASSNVSRRYPPSPISALGQASFTGPNSATALHSFQDGARGARSAGGPGEQELLESTETARQQDQDRRSAEEKRIVEEDRKKVDEERQKVEEKWKEVNDDRKKVEEDRKKVDEDRKKVNEARKKAAEDMKKVDEESKKLDEARKQAAEDRKKAMEERKSVDNARNMAEEDRKKVEEEKKKLEEDRKKVEKEWKNVEEAKKQAEERMNLDEAEKEAALAAKTQKIEEEAKKRAQEEQAKGLAKEHGTTTLAAKRTFKGAVKENRPLAMTEEHRRQEERRQEAEGSNWQSVGRNSRQNLDRKTRDEMEELAEQTDMEMEEADSRVDEEDGGSRVVSVTVVDSPSAQLKSPGKPVLAQSPPLLPPPATVMEHDPELEPELGGDLDTIRKNGETLRKSAVEIERSIQAMRDTPENDQQANHQATIDELTKEADMLYTKAGKMTFYANNTPARSHSVDVQNLLIRDAIPHVKAALTRLLSAENREQDEELYIKIYHKPNIRGYALKLNTAITAAMEEHGLKVTNDTSDGAGLRVDLPAAEP